MPTAPTWAAWNLSADGQREVRRLFWSSALRRYQLTVLVAVAIALAGLVAGWIQDRTAPPHSGVTGADVTLGALAIVGDALVVAGVLLWSRALRRIAFRPCPSCGQWILGSSTPCTKCGAATPATPASPLPSR